jgi:hypothetical protein
MPSPAINAQIASAIESFRFNELGLRQLLAGPEGGVCRDLVRRGIRVEGLAKQIATATPPSTPGGGPAVRTGRLRGSITWRLGADGISPYVDVGSGVYYAPYVEMGTSRMQARPFLRPGLQAARATW